MIICPGRVGRGDVAQLHSPAAAADRQAGAEPRALPTRRRVQGHRQVSARVTCDTA